MYFNRDINYLEFLKNRKTVIFGYGAAGIACMLQLQKRGIEVCMFIDNSKEKQGIHRQPERQMNVVSFEEFQKINDCSKHMIVICSRYEKEIKEQLLGGEVYNFISMHQIDFGGGVEHYDELYFKYQEEVGKFGAKIKKKMFEKYLFREACVLDFGCGSGELLQLLDVKDKAGVEINDYARKKVRDKGISCYKELSELPDEAFDIVISNSALEHVENPFGALKTLRKKLKGGGKMVFYVPNESCDTEYVPNDANNHLYTWNCLNLGNLFKAAGYFVQSVERVQEVWPENYQKISQEISPEFFDTLCRMGGKVWNENRCLIVAYK